MLKKTLHNICNYVIKNKIQIIFATRKKLIKRLIKYLLKKELIVLMNNPYINKNMD